MTPPPNYFRFVKVDASGGGGGGGTWALLTITGAATHQPNATYTTNLMGGNNGKFLHFGFNDPSGDVSTDQYIEAWAGDSNDAHGVVLKGDLTGSEMRYNGSGLWHSYRRGWPMLDNACYNVANDMFFAAADPDHGNLMDRDDPVTILTRFTGSGYDGYDSLGEITASFQQYRAQNRHILTCNNEVLGFESQGSTWNTEAYSGKMYAYTIEGQNETSLDFGNLQLTRSADTVSVEQQGDSETSKLNTGGAVADKSQNYVALGFYYHDTNSYAQNRKAALILASGSSGYYHRSQVTSSAWGTDGLRKQSGIQIFDTLSRQIAFNDDYLILGVPGADGQNNQDGSTGTNQGGIEIHKRLSTGWDTSELVLSMSGSEVLAAAGLSDANHDSQIGGCSVGATVDIAPNGDFIVSAPTWRDSGDASNRSRGAAMVFAKDSGADTWSYAVHLTGSTTWRASNPDGANDACRFGMLVNIENDQAYVSYTVGNTDGPSWTDDHGTSGDNEVLTLAVFRKS